MSLHPRLDRGPNRVISWCAETSFAGLCSEEWHDCFRGLYLYWKCFRPACAETSGVPKDDRSGEATISSYWCNPGVEIQSFCPQSGRVHCLQEHAQERQCGCDQCVWAIDRGTFWQPDRAHHRMDGWILFYSSLWRSSPRHEGESSTEWLSEFSLSGIQCSRARETFCDQWGRICYRLLRHGSVR